VLLAIYIAGAIAAAGQSRLMVVVAQRTVSDIRADFSAAPSLPSVFTIRMHGT